MRIGIAALALTVPALLQLHGRWHLLRRAAGSVVAFGLMAVTGAQLFFFNAVEHLSVGVALLLEYSGTLLVVAWMWLRHHQRPSRLTLVGGVVAIGGLVLVLDLTGSQRVDLVGVLWGLGAATGLATYFVISAHGEDVLPPVVTAWSGMLVGAATLGAAGLVGIVPFRMATRDVHFAGHTTSWLVPAAGVSLVGGGEEYTPQNTAPPPAPSLFGPRRADPPRRPGFRNSAGRHALRRADPERGGPRGWGAGGRGGGVMVRRRRAPHRRRPPAASG